MNRETRIFILGILGTLFFATALATHVINWINGEISWLMWFAPLQLIFCIRCLFYIHESIKK